MEEIYTLLDLAERFELNDSDEEFEKLMKEADELLGEYGGW